MTSIEQERAVKGVFDLIIPNFKKWNPDTRGKRSWFALSVHFYSDPRVMQLTMSERGWWIHLLAMYAQGHSNLRGTTCEVLAKSVGSTGQGPTKSLLKFLKLGLIELRSVSLQTDITDITKQTEDDGDLTTSVVHNPPPAPKVVPPSSSLEVLLTGRGKEFFKKILGEQFDPELQKCHVYWEAQAPPRKPFPVVFSRWVERWQRDNAKENPTVDWKKVFED